LRTPSEYAVYTVRGHIQSQEDLTSGIPTTNDPGEMPPDQFWETTMNPTNRVVLLVTLMNDLVLPRCEDNRVHGELGGVGGLLRKCVKCRL